MSAPFFLSLLLLAAGSAFAQVTACSAQSPATRTTVVELYTSEGCSSCPPADRWLSGLKEAAAQGKVVAQAFHVSYWDSLGWIDRFAAPAHNARQREIAARRGSTTVYTPQLVRDGRDARDFSAPLPSRAPAAGAVIRLRRDGPQVIADVTPVAAGRPWSAYWTVTEHGHQTRVRAGENAGESLAHDFVVRQLAVAGTHTGPRSLSLQPAPASPGHAQQVNLVVTDPASGEPLQALSLQCRAAG